MTFYALRVYLTYNYNLNDACCISISDSLITPLKSCILSNKTANYYFKITRSPEFRTRIRFITNVMFLIAFCANTVRQSGKNVVASSAIKLLKIPFFVPVRYNINLILMRYRPRPIRIFVSQKQNKNHIKKK